ncbi:hypothetical protein [Hymenobacter sp.]|jgi:hypothetical protein|uniref:hypothetical protein n=1 Tax=Hymenobacter sp. TaxID=1898978 RepID=UPI002ED79F50
MLQTIYSCLSYFYINLNLFFKNIALPVPIYATAKLGSFPALTLKKLSVSAFGAFIEIISIISAIPGGIKNSSTLILVLASSACLPDLLKLALRHTAVPQSDVLLYKSKQVLLAQ